MAGAQLGKPGDERRRVWRTLEERQTAAAQATKRVPLASRRSTYGECALAGPNGFLVVVVGLFARESKRLGAGGFGFAALRMIANLSGPRPAPASESS